MITILYYKHIYMSYIYTIYYNYNIYIYTYTYNYYRTSLKYDKLSVPQHGMIPRIDWRLKSDLSMGQVVHDTRRPW